MTHKDVIKAIIVLALISTSVIKAQQLGSALYYHGYINSLNKGDFWFETSLPLTQRLVVGVFDPSNLDAFSGKRYNFPSHTKGPVVGPEGISNEIIDEAFSCSGLPERLGLPVGYKSTQLDLYDVENLMAVFSEDGSVWNKVIIPAAANCSTSIPPTCPPCPACPPEIICPPVVTCPPIVPCAPPVSIPSYVLDTAKESYGWTFIGKGRAAKLFEMYKWLAEYQASVESSGKDTIKIKNK